MKDFQAIDWRMRQNSKVLREVLRRLEEYERPEHALLRVPKLVNIPDSPHESVVEDMVWGDMSREEFINKLRACIEI